MAEISPTIVEIESQPAIAVRGDVPISDLPKFFERAFVACFEAAGAAGVEIVGPPFGYYPEMPCETVAIEAGFPVSAPIVTSSDVHPFELPGGKVIEVVHVGPFETMEKTYAALQDWVQQRGLTPAVEMWEVYLSDPQIEPDASKWETKIVWPLLP